MQWLLAFFSLTQPSWTFLGIHTHACTGLKLVYKAVIFNACLGTIALDNTFGHDQLNIKEISHIDSALDQSMDMHAYPTMY